MNDRLMRAMRRLADESARVEAPPGIEAALLAEFDRAGRRRRRLSWTVAAAAIAASVAIVFSWDRHPNVPLPAPAAVVSEDAQAEQPFVPIPYVAPLAQYERAEVVRMELPVSVLIAAGFPMRALKFRFAVEITVQPSPGITPLVPQQAPHPGVVRIAPSSSNRASVPSARNWLSTSREAGVSTNCTPAAMRPPARSRAASAS